MKRLLIPAALLALVAVVVASASAGTANPLHAQLRVQKAKVAKLDVDLLLPAHEFDTRDLQGRVAEIRAHHEQRLDEMERCIGEGATAWEVAGRVKWATGLLADFTSSAL